MGRENRHTISVKTLLLIIAGIALVVGVVLFILANQKLLSKPRELPFGASSEYVYTGTGYIYIAGQSVRYTDLTDSSYNYSGTLPHESMKLSGYKRDTHVVYDGSTLCIIGLSEAVTADGNILSVRCGDGFVACEVDTGAEKKVEVYNLIGEKVEEINSSETIVKYDFCHTQKEQLYVVTLNTDSDTLLSTLTTYDPEVPAMTGIITVQNQLVENVVFTKKSVFILGTANLIRIDLATNKESYRLITRGYHMGDYFEKGSKVYFVMYPDDGNQNYIRLYQASQSTTPSEKVVPFQLPDSTLGVFVHEGNVYAMTANVVYMYDDRGTLKTTETLDFTVDSVYDTGGDSLLCSSANRLYAIRITGTNKIREKLGK